MKLLKPNESFWINGIRHQQVSQGQKKQQEDLFHPHKSLSNETPLKCISQNNFFLLFCPSCDFWSIMNSKAFQWCSWKDFKETQTFACSDAVTQAKLRTLNIAWSNRTDILQTCLSFAFTADLCRWHKWPVVGWTILRFLLFPCWRATPPSAAQAKHNTCIMTCPPENNLV